MENYIVDLDGDGFSADEFADIKKCLETLLYWTDFRSCPGILRKRG